MAHLIVSLSPREAADAISQYVLREGVSTQCVGTYGNISPEGRESIMLVFEKYFMRNSSRASLSVMVENLSGQTCVYSVGSGGGKNALFSFDWGAGDSFAGLPAKAMEPYTVARIG